MAQVGIVTSSGMQHHAPVGGTIIIVPPSVPLTYGRTETPAPPPVPLTYGHSLTIAAPVTLANGRTRTIAPSVTLTDGRTGTIAPSVILTDGRTGKIAPPVTLANGRRIGTSTPVSALTSFGSPQLCTTSVNAVVLWPKYSSVLLPTSASPKSYIPICPKDNHLPPQKNTVSLQIFLNKLY